MDLLTMKYFIAASEHPFVWSILIHVASIEIDPLDVALVNPVRGGTQMQAISPKTHLSSAGHIPIWVGFKLDYGRSIFDRVIASQNWADNCEGFKTSDSCYDIRSFLSGRDFPVLPMKCNYCATYLAEGSLNTLSLVHFGSDFQYSPRGIILLSNHSM